MENGEASVPPTTSVQTAIEHDVATVTLARPSLGNAIDLDMATGLADTFATLRSSNVRAVIVNGAGARFCVGGDLHHFAAGPLADRVAPVAAALRSAISDLHRLRAPAIAAVHGAVAGAGLGLACACDIVVADRSTVFVTAYRGVGLSPDAGVSWLLPRRVGVGRAMQLLHLDARLDADEAVQQGLADVLVDTGQVHASAADLARRLSEQPRESVRATTQLVRRSATRSLDQQLDHEIDELSICAHDPEGRSAFESTRLRLVGDRSSAT